MGFDYYAFCHEKLMEVFAEIESASAELKAADDKAAKKRAEEKINKPASKAVDINAHSASLWYEAADSELRNSIREAWRKKRPSAGNIPEVFGFKPDVAAIKHLPQLSFALCVPFRLRKPYLSRDERDFYLLDNPVRKEKIFQVPMVASTSWKGVLRGTMCSQVREWWNGLDEQSRKTWKSRRELVFKRRQLIRLFGNEREADHGFFAGQLHFYSTFFDRDQITLEVINPHERRTGVGKQPILVESVRAKAQGDLVIVYAPFGSLEQAEAKRRAKVAEDIRALCTGIQAMLTVYGFGAKTSSGFGIAEDKLARSGTLAIRAALPNFGKVPVADTRAKQEPPAQYLESATTLRQDLRDASGGLKSEAEYEALVKATGREYRKTDRQLYEKARKWWEKRQSQAPAETPHEPATETPAAEAPALEKVEFGSLKELCEKAEAIKAALMQGEAV